MKSAELISSKNMGIPQEDMKHFLATGVRFEDVMGSNTRVDSSMLADAMADEAEEKEGKEMQEKKHKRKGSQIINSIPNVMLASFDSFVTNL